MKPERTVSEYIRCHIAAPYTGYWENHVQYIPSMDCSLFTYHSNTRLLHTASSFFRSRTPVPAYWSPTVCQLRFHQRNTHTHTHIHVIRKQREVNAQSTFRAPTTPKCVGLSESLCHPVASSCLEYIPQQSASASAVLSAGAAQRTGLPQRQKSIIVRPITCAGVSVCVCMCVWRRLSLCRHFLRADCKAEIA